MSTPKQTNENRKNEPTTPRDASVTEGGSARKASTTTGKQTDRPSKTREDVNEDDSNTKTR